VLQRLASSKSASGKSGHIEVPTVSKQQSPLVRAASKKAVREAIPQASAVQEWLSEHDGGEQSDAPPPDAETPRKRGFFSRLVLWKPKEAHETRYGASQVAPAPNDGEPPTTAERAPQSSTQGSGRIGGVGAKSARDAKGTLNADMPPTGRERDGQQAAAGAGRGAGAGAGGAARRGPSAPSQHQPVVFTSNPMAGAPIGGAPFMGAGVVTMGLGGDAGVPLTVAGPKAMKGKGLTSKGARTTNGRTVPIGPTK
jgi:hypothetical protein